MTPLDGKVAFVVGVTNAHSIATGCAQAFVDAGANRRNAKRVTSAASDIDVLIIPTDEPAIVAEATQRLAGIAAVRCSNAGVSGC